MIGTKFKDPLFLTWTLIAFTTLIRLVIAGTTGLGVGEAYYFRGALDLQLSYLDQPPLFLWLSGLSIRLFGFSNLALRLPAVLFFVGTQWFLFALTRRFFSSKAGFYAVLILNLSFIFTVPVAVWFQPDAPLMFFWILCCYFLTKVLFPIDPLNNKDLTSSRSTYGWWVLIGISSGLAILSKYHAVFLLVGSFLFVLFDDKRRHWVWHPGPYAALCVALLVSLPVLIWNAQHDWASFIFQGSRAGSGAGFELRIDRFFRSVLGQAIWLAPWIWIPLIGQLVAAFRKRKKDPIQAFIFSMAVLPILFFTVVSLWSRIGFHFHWQAPGYLMLFIPLGATVAGRLSTKGLARGRARRWLIGTALATVLLSALLLVHTETGLWRVYGPAQIVQKTLGKSDPTIAGRDYDEIALRFRQERWREQDSLFVGTTRWWQAGKIDWALKGSKEVLVFDRDSRNYAFFTHPLVQLGSDAIIITENSSEVVEENVKPFFDEILRLDDIEIKRNQVTELSLKVYFATNFHLPNTEREDLPLYRQLKGKPPF